MGNSKWVILVKSTNTTLPKQFLLILIFIFLSTLIDLCKLPQPNNPNGQEHAGVTIRSLLENPDATWDHPGLTTFGRNNHALRSQHYRYIRYADGSEELYDHRSDPMEFINLFDSNELTQVKQHLAQWFPKQNVPEAPIDPNRKKPKK